MDVVTTIIVLIVVIAVVVVVIYLLCSTRKESTPHINIEEGKFLWLEETQWHLQPITVLSSNTILGTPMFPDDRYDPAIDSLTTLYGGKLITDKQAWVIRGSINKAYKFWSFGLFKMNDTPDLSLKSVGYSFNSEMLRDIRDGDDVVVIVSPNYKLATFIANQIHQKDYDKRLDNDKHVVFRYFPMADYDASVKYTFLFEALKTDSGLLPSFTVFRYTYDPKDKDTFPFYPVERGKDIPTITKQTIDEHKLLGTDESTFDRQIERQIKSYKDKKVNTFLTPHGRDYIYSASTMDVRPGDMVVAGVLDHSASGKCLYSEILFLDVNSRQVYDSKIVSIFDQAGIDEKARVKIFISAVPRGVTKIVVLERIVVDISTRIAPDPTTIVPARVYVVGS